MLEALKRRFARRTEETEEMQKAREEVETAVNELRDSIVAFEANPTNFDLAHTTFLSCRSVHLMCPARKTRTFGDLQHQITDCRLRTLKCLNAFPHDDPEQSKYIAHWADRIIVHMSVANHVMAGNREAALQIMQPPESLVA